jgi:hypothetical protein
MRQNTHVIRKSAKAAILFVSEKKNIAFVCSTPFIFFKLEVRKSEANDPGTGTRLLPVVVEAALCAIFCSWLDFVA